MRIKGVVFDMDGLMLNSEVLYEQSALQVMQELGLEPSVELVRESIGMPESSWAQLLTQHYGEALDVKLFGKHCKAYMEAWYMQQDIPTKPGLFELLGYLRTQGIACAVATSTYQRHARAQLERLGVAPYLSAFVFGDMVENGKPAPDIFLRAVQELGLQPQECMGLEDSYNGVRSSSGAGLYTVMVPDLLPPTDEILALTGDCVATLHEIIPILEELNTPVAAQRM